MLAAETMGLASCWIGYLQETFFMNKKLKKLFNIPKGEDVWGVMTLGYPAVKYKRTPPRAPLKVVGLD